MIFSCNLVRQNHVINYTNLTNTNYYTPLDKKKLFHSFVLTLCFLVTPQVHHLNSNYIFLLKSSYPCLRSTKNHVSRCAHFYYSGGWVADSQYSGFSSFCLLQITGRFLQHTYLAGGGEWKPAEKHSTNFLFLKIK